MQVKFAPGSRALACEHVWQPSLKLELVMQKVTSEVVPSFLTVQAWLTFSPMLARPLTSSPSAHVLFTSTVCVSTTMRGYERRTRRQLQMDKMKTIRMVNRYRTSMCIDEARSKIYVTSGFRDLGLKLYYGLRAHVPWGSHANMIDVDDVYCIISKQSIFNPRTHTQGLLNPSVLCMTKSAYRGTRLPCRAGQPCSRRVSQSGTLQSPRTTQCPRFVSPRCPYLPG